MTTDIAALADGLTEAQRGAIVRDAMAQGYGPPARKVDRCEHGKFGWEDCISCYDDHLDRVLDAVLRGDHRKDQTND